MNPDLKIADVIMHCLIITTAHIEGDDGMRLENRATAE
jgi:hypothetical protein